MTPTLFLAQPPESNPTSSSSRALELRRGIADAVQVPGSWLLDSPSLENVVCSARGLARLAGAPILLQGERGLGLAELARLVHEEDPVACDRRFRIVPADHVGTSDMRGGTSDGTILVEDLENLGPVGQAWIGEIMNSRIRSGRPVRIIASSRLSVGELLQQRQLSQELIHTLDVGRLVVPPLRQRPGDIIELGRRFLQHYAEKLHRPALRFSAEAEGKLLSHGYPANVRELRNIVERAMAVATADEIGAEAIVFYEERFEVETRNRLAPFSSAKNDERVGRFPSLSEVERDYLKMLIRELRGHRVAMSQVMGISYQTVLRKIARHGLDVRAIVSKTAEPQHRAAG
jgi:DNA-binding NtrC family response regulator